MFIIETRMINGVEVNLTGYISDDELATYLIQLQAGQQQKIVKADVTVNDDFLDVNYTLRPVPFERIRRITGYLVGTTARWGDAKQAELHDRVIHA